MRDLRGRDHFMESLDIGQEEGISVDIVWWNVNVVSVDRCLYVDDTR